MLVLIFYISLLVQNSLVSLQKDISQQFDSLLNKLSSQTDMVTELKERVQKVNICMYGYCR